MNAATWQSRINHKYLYYHSKKEINMHFMSESSHHAVQILVLIVCLSVDFIRQLSHFRDKTGEHFFIF